MKRRKRVRGGGEGKGEVEEREEKKEEGHLVRVHPFLACHHEFVAP